MEECVFSDCKNCLYSYIFNDSLYCDHVFECQLQEIRDYLGEDYEEEI